MLDAGQRNSDTQGLAARCSNIHSVLSQSPIGYACVTFGQVHHPAAQPDRILPFLHDMSSRLRHVSHVAEGVRLWGNECEQS